MHRLAHLLLLLAFAGDAIACSFAPGYEEFVFGIPDSEGIAPEEPKLTGIEIKRGFNDGNYTSCSDAGVISLYFARTEGVGYLFEPLVEFEDALFPVEVVKVARRTNHFFFVWLDGSEDVQEPIYLPVRVTAFYPNGQRSKSIEIRIMHPGGRSGA